MQFSEQWLRTLVDPPLDSAALDHLLTMAGLEVEEATPAAADFSGVVVARILSADKHPGADKLKVCRVDAGDGGEPLQIVCGAPNAAAGMNVPLAKVGAQLPGLTIKAAKLRGVESFGMLCSARELGLSDDHGGLLELASELTPGADLRTTLALDDTLFTVKLTPNRADCLSLTGIAREVAALTGQPLKAVEIAPVVATITDQRGIVLDAPQACPRYLGRIVRGVDARAATPDWMKQRLERSGVRSISALVDVTNYVMLELGQPLHVFDDAKLEGSIHVRMAQPGETLLLLNEQTIDITADTLVIADEKKALALAGVMGGEQSGVTLDTRDVFIEAAFFVPEAIAGRAREYGFSSDASHRYERGVDFALAARAMERATALMLELCGGQAGPVVEAVSTSDLPARAAVRLSPSRANRLLGIELDRARMAELLRGVHLQVEDDGEALIVTPPSFRFDINIEEDLVEEVARLHGYENIPLTPPRGVLAMLPQTENRRSVWNVRHELAARDFFEVINYAFVPDAWERDFCANDAPIRLANPIASQMNVMRTSLIGGLVANVIANRRRQQSRVRVFEIGRCFLPADGGVVPGYAQPVKLAALASGTALAEQWGAATRNVDFYDLKGDLEALLGRQNLRFAATSHPALHPGRAASVERNGRLIGVIGELHPALVQRYELGSAPIVFEIELEAALDGSLPLYQPLSRMPIVARDIALIVAAELRVDQVLDELRKAAGAQVRSIELFDVYAGKGIEPEKKSLAFRIFLQDAERTLEDAEVEAAINALVTHAESTLGASLRR